MAGTQSSGRSVDATPVPDATIADLDPAAVAVLLSRLRQRQPKTFGALDDVSALRRLRVLTDTRDGRVPTLAGLLALGSRPQDFRPDLGVTLVVYPGRSANDRAAGDPTSRTFEGPVPAMVSAVATTIAGAAPVRTEVPSAALAEVVTNALLHRDYTPGWTAAAQERRVVVAVYARHLTVISPGGLVAPLTEADLADEAVDAGRAPVVTRNPVLARVLAQVELPGADRMVATNRGNGIPAVQRELAARGLARAEFHHHPGWFTVILRRPRPPARTPRSSPAELIRAALASGEALGRWAIEQATGLTRGTVMNQLNLLIGDGEVEALGSEASRRRTYRLTGHRQTPP